MTGWKGRMKYLGKEAKTGIKEKEIEVYEGYERNVLLTFYMGCNKICLGLFISDFPCSGCVRILLVFQCLHFTPSSFHSLLCGHFYWPPKARISSQSKKCVCY